MSNFNDADSPIQLTPEQEYELRERFKAGEWRKKPESIEEEANKRLIKHRIAHSVEYDNCPVCVSVGNTPRYYYQEALAILNGSSMMQPEVAHLKALRNKHLEDLRAIYADVKGEK